MKKVVFIGIILLGVLVASCNPEDNGTEPLPVETATLKLHLHTYIGEEEVELYNAVYRNTSNRKISLSISQLYISEVALVKYDGSLYYVGDSIILTDIINQVYSLGKVPVGNYKSIRFNVGLSPVLNARVPSGAGILNNADMWFSPTAQANNYVFMKCVGKIDTTLAATAADIDMVPFQYVIGTNARLTQVSMPVQNYAVQPNATTFIHMKADYAEIGRAHV